LLAYERINPHGEWRADLRMARVCATVVNSNAFRSAGDPPAKEADFLPDFARERAQQSVGDMKRWAERLSNLGEFE
jgi:hypothetical protein